MIDFHTHILPGVDDGSRDLEMSLSMLKGSHSEGVKHICLTPHFIVGEYEIYREEYEQKIENLRQNLDNINVDLLPGLEVYINPDLPQLYKERKIWGINDTRYVLIELPMQQFPIYTEKVFYQLRLEGAIPIIAHPERNLSIIKDRGLLETLINEGTIVQMNSGSLIGRYGTTVKRFAEELVGMNMVHILGSDAHNNTTRSTQLIDGYDTVKKINPSLYKWILSNEKKIIDNEDIELPEIKSLKKKKRNIFDFLKRK